MLTPRRRAVIAVLVSWPLGWLYLYVELLHGAGPAAVLPQRAAELQPGVAVAVQLVRGNYSPTLTWIELLASTGLVVAVAAYLMGRWVVHPIASMADTVARFGPTSVGLRLRPTGPADETRRLAEAIDAMLDRLAEGYEAQRRFAFNASHELRTPLATQRALIEVSLSSALTPEQLDLLSRQLLATNQRNEQLVEGLLTLAETDRGLAASSRVRVDELARDTVELLRASAKERDVEIDTDLAALTVAGRAAAAGTVAGQPDPERDQVQRAGRDGAALPCTVTAPSASTTPGRRCRPDAVPGLFEPFRRLSGERLDHGGGVGLGLTIARSIVAAHGATIEARANPGGGLSVTVQLQPAPA